LRIGPVYARASKAGIFSFWQLSANPERIKRLSSGRVAKLDFESWIAQAKAMAEPDQLEMLMHRPRYARRRAERRASAFTNWLRYPTQIQEFVGPKAGSMLMPKIGLLRPRFVAKKRRNLRKRASTQSIIVPRAG
jgi:hypothetical protein